METLEIIGTIVGIVYLVLEFRASYYLWIAGLVMPAIYLFVYYNAGLYADFGINVYYCLASVYGLIVWKVKQKRGMSDVGTPLRISRMPLRLYLPAFLVFMVLLVVIAWVLIRFTNSTVPWLDSFTTSLSIVALWMLARKYAEQWLAWVAVDAVSAGLYIYKSLHFTAGLYLLYTIIAIFGYRKWLQWIKEGK